MENEAKNDLESLLYKITPNERIIIGSMEALRGANLPITIYNNVIDRIFDNYLDNVHIVNRALECFGKFSRCMSINPDKEYYEIENRKHGAPEFPEYESVWERDARFYGLLTLERTYEPTGYETTQEKRNIILGEFHKWITERERAWIIPSLDYLIKRLEDMSNKNNQIVRKRTGIKPVPYMLTESVYNILANKRKELETKINSDPFAEFNPEELVICGLEHEVLKRRIKFFDNNITRFISFADVLFIKGIYETKTSIRPYGKNNKKWFEIAKKAYREASETNFKTINEVQKTAFKTQISTLDADGRYISVNFIKLISEKLIPLSDSMKLLLDAVKESNYEENSEKYAEYEKKTEKEREEKRKEWQTWADQNMKNKIGESKTK